METIYVTKGYNNSHGDMVKSRSYRIKDMALEHLKRELSYINTDTSLQDKYKKAFEAEIERRERKEVLYEVY